MNITSSNNISFPYPKPTIKIRRLRPDTEPLITLQRPLPPQSETEVWSLAAS